MQVEQIPPGRAVPDDINVVIEIPAYAAPVKYELDKASGALFVDRFMFTAMHYPCNYGFVPGTLSEDGDPVDVLVVTPLPLIHGSVVRARPLGMLKMTDEAGVDAKVIAVPVDKLSPMYSDCRSPQDLPQALLDQVAHFFEHYKDLEPGKWVKVEGWVGPEEARAEIEASVRRYQAQRQG
ncbi:MAG: inorganic diphosphatase [Gammaproteobacteria bacterium]|nr:MAG: inorganic diphosphatase [Gammaproteobacteria bacterium]